MNKFKKQWIVKKNNLQNFIRKFKMILNCTFKKSGKNLKIVLKLLLVNYQIQMSLIYQWIK